MQWKDQDLRTLGDLLDAVTAVESRDEAQQFMAAYRVENPHAGENIGYLAGYCDQATAKHIWDWFGCAHPVFGTNWPTPEEAFKAGTKLAAK